MGRSSDDRCTSATTTTSGAGRSSTTPGCSRSSASRGSRPGWRGSRSCASARRSAPRSPVRSRRWWRGFGDGRRRPAARRRGHRAPPGEDRGSTINNAADVLRRAARRVGFARGLRVVVRTRAAAPSDGPTTIPVDHPGVDGAEPRPQASRLALRRAHDRVRVHAGHGPGGRPPRSRAGPATCAKPSGLRSRRPARADRPRPTGASAAPGACGRRIICFAAR